MSLGDDRVLPTVSATWAQEDEAPDEPQPPADGPRYLELGLLGRGGLGEVVEARDADLRRHVALKRPLGAPTGAQVRALVREAQITAQLAHPGVPPVHALGLDAEGRPYFTMARLRGRTLAEVLKEGPLPPRRAVRWFVQVAWAVAYAHTHGVIHRDLKPSNVMVGEFGDVYVLDWGIARVVGDPSDERNVTVSHPNAGSSRIEGTPGYAAPEQLRGESGDARTDVYALGAVLYEMLEGALPVPAADTDAARQATLSGSLRELASHTSPVLAAIVRRALATDPEQRYPSVAALVADLEAWQDGDAVSAYAEAHLHQLHRKYMSRSPGLRRLRWVDVDVWCGSASFLGLAAGVWLERWVNPWLALALGALLFLPPTWRVFYGPDE